jgi:aspartate racemase
LSGKYGLQVLLPPKEDRDLIHRLVFDELALGIIREQSRQELIRIIHGLNERGAQGVIEGCTELVLSVRQEHTEVPLFDTTAIHVEEALEMAFQ